jgi:integrase
MRFNDATLKALPTPQKGQKLYSDASIPGFGLRVGSRSRVFVLTVGRERERITIGKFGPDGYTLAEARKRAQSILRDRELGIVQKPTPLFSVVKSEFLAQRDTKVRRTTRLADKYLFQPFDVLSQKKIGDISAEAIEEVIEVLDAPMTRRHAYLRIKGLFAYAVKRGYIDRSPAERLDCVPQGEARERVLTDDELRCVIHTARAYPHAYGRIVELCAVLGQRRLQIGALHKDYVDFEAQTITWPPELMKTGRRHTIPFGPTTRAILADITPNEDGLYFPSRVNSPFVGWSYHKARFDAACEVPDFRLHDLRRTFATRWQEMGIEIATTEKYLSHSAVTGGLVGIYQRSTYLEQMRAAVLLWETHLRTRLPDAKIADHAA